jgi:hypothetical protein
LLVLPQPRSNLELLEDAAAKLKELVSEVVFVGGATLDLIVTDEAAGPVRGTTDVDVIAEIATYRDYVSFALRLRECGFSEDLRENAPLCRWVHGNLTLDVMPLDEKVLGFSNIWYPGSLKDSKRGGSSERQGHPADYCSVFPGHQAGGVSRTGAQGLFWQP